MLSFFLGTSSVYAQSASDLQGGISWACIQYAVVPPYACYKPVPPYVGIAVAYWDYVAGGVLAGEGVPGELAGGAGRGELWALPDSLPGSAGVGSAASGGQGDLLSAVSGYVHRAERAEFLLL